MVYLLPRRRERRRGILIVSAGTADQAVAGEARLTCRYLGQEPEMLVDVGVAGIHRLLRRTETLQEARVVIAVAGMDSPASCRSSCATTACRTSWSTMTM